MLPKLDFIRYTRIRLAVTQKQLAKLTGVSTSMINQVETGRCKPSYDTAKRIFEALADLENESSPKAGEVCTKSIITASPTDRIIEVAELMRSKGFSQLPVMKDGKAVGMISDDSIIQAIISSKTENTANLEVKEIMGPPPPMVHSSTPVRALVNLVQFSKALLVTDNDRLAGILTSSDILKLAA